MCAHCGQNRLGNGSHSMYFPSARRRRKPPRPTRTPLLQLSFLVSLFNCMYVIASYSQNCGGRKDQGGPASGRPRHFAPQPINVCTQRSSPPSQSHDSHQETKLVWAADRPFPEYHPPHPLSMRVVAPDLTFPPSLGPYCPAPLPRSS